MKFIKSPLRYPGGKSRAIAEISQQLPEVFSEYREPFVGGGSVFIFIRQKFPDVHVWINDKNYDLYCFWHTVQTNAQGLVYKLFKIKKEMTDGKQLFHLLRNNLNEQLSEFERAVRFFVLNRVSFSGTVDCGGYSEQAFQSRFTDSSINRILTLAPLLQGVRITHLDYREVIHEDGEDIFIFLDPPYLTAKKSRLYGKNGDLHLTFQHEQFAEEMKQCNHSWMITYDDSPIIRNHFRFAHVHQWQLQYGMNNFKQNIAAKGKELIITNYFSYHKQLCFL